MFHFKKKSISTKLKEDELLKLTKEGKLVTRKVGTLSIVFAQENNQLFAFKNKCPHQGQKLDGGWCEHGKIVCPIHQYKFDLETGRGHGDAMYKYDVTIENEEIVLWYEKFVLF